MYGRMVDVQRKGQNRYSGGPTLAIVNGVPAIVLGAAMTLLGGILALR